MWLHSMFDLSWSSLFFFYSLFRYHLRHCLWCIPFTLPPLFFSYTNIFQVWYFPCIILVYLIISLICFISHYQFDLLHRLIIDIIFTLGTFRSMAHEFFNTCCILYMRAWVFDHWVFGPSFPSFLLSYHLSLRYVPCLKTTLRPWDQMSSSTAPTWTGIWNLVDI